NEAPRYVQLLPELPRLLHHALNKPAAPAGLDNQALEALLREQRKTNRVLYALVFGGVGFFFGVLVMQILLRWRAGVG
ncbi:MAG: ubiquinone biosynthesis regulatory protein kinase UbiB, partial [Burkholderiales bacterium]